MASVVLPLVTGHSRWTVATTNVIAAPTDIGAIAAADVRVAIEVVVAVNRDIVVPAPAASPTPPSAPGSSHSYPNAK